MNDPERWLTSADAPPSMAALLAEARDERPSERAVARMATRLEGVAPLPRPYLARAALGLVLVGGSIAWLVASQSDPAPQAEAPSPAPVRALSTPYVAPLPSDASPSAASDEPEAPAPASAVQPVALPSELALIRGARDALGTQPARSLSLLEQHRRLYPSGKLAEEREVLTIDALRRQGRIEDANVRVRRFLTSHPSSAHRSRLERESGLGSE